MDKEFAEAFKEEIEGIYDTEFAKEFKEEIELAEKWEAGVVYHQDFGGGEISYFRADSLLKNKRWKGMAVDEFGGKQRRPKNITADEKVSGWKITPKNKIPKGLKEEVDEARKAAKDVGLECQECGKRFRSKNPRYGVTKCPKCKSTDLDLAYGEEVEVDEARSREDELELAKTIAAWKKAGGKVKKLPPGKKFKSLFKGKPLPRQEEVEIEEGKFKKGDIVIPNLGPHKGDKHKIIHDFGDGSYNITPQKHPRNIKYKLGAAKAKENQLKLVKEDVELDEKGTAYPATVDTLRKIVKDKQHQTVMFKSGKAIVDLFTASAMVQVYDALKKPDMKKTFEKMITDKAGFMKTQAFAMKMIGK